MYTGFGLPARPVGEAQQRAMAAIGAVREGAYKTVSQAPGHLGLKHAYRRRRSGPLPIIGSKTVVRARGRADGSCTRVAAV